MIIWHSDNEYNECSSFLYHSEMKMKQYHQCNSDLIQQIRMNGEPSVVHFQILSSLHLLAHFCIKFEYHMHSHHELVIPLIKKWDFWKMPDPHPCRITLPKLLYQWDNINCYTKWIINWFIWKLWYYVTDVHVVRRQYLVLTRSWRE